MIAWRKLICRHNYDHVPLSLQPVGITCDWALNLTVEYSSVEKCSKCGDEKICTGWYLPKGVGLSVEEYKEQQPQ